MPQEQVRGLQVDEDIGYHRRSWRTQRIGWVIMALIVVATLLGLLGGDGPLNQPVAGQRGGELWVEYDRFMRSLGPTELRIHLDQLRPDERTVRLLFDGHYLQAIHVERIEPEPRQQWASPEGVVYEFDVADTEPAIEIRYDIEPEHIGLLHTPIVKLDGPTVMMKSFVYP